MGLSNAEIKKVNRNNILRYLLKSDIVSKNGIAYSLELTAPTVTSALKDLQDLGLIKEEGAMDSNGGRKSMGYSCNKDAKFAVGINISKDYVDLAIINLVLEAVYTRHEKIQIRGNETSYKWLKEYISDAIEKARISRKKILGMCKTGFPLKSSPPSQRSFCRSSRFLRLKNPSSSSLYTKRMRTASRTAPTVT